MCTSTSKARLLALKCVSNLRISSNFSSSQVTLGKKSRDPYDKRFGIHVLDAGPDKKGGSQELVDEILKQPQYPRKPGVYDVAGKFHFVPEMVPEFVVPDLTNFKLKPYVDYSIKQVTQKEFLPEDLFRQTYGKEYIDEFQRGNIDHDTLVKKINKLKEA